jgi:hypothetical protein
MNPETAYKRSVGRRLASASSRLAALQVRLEALHADRSGVAELMYRPPLIPDEWFHLGVSIRRIQTDADRGCAQSVEWLRDTTEQRALIDRLRATPLTPRAPDYDGPWLMPMHAKWMGKPTRRPAYRQAVLTARNPAAQPDEEAHG